MIDENKLFSFSSANTFPMKILLNPEIIIGALERKNIPSIHLQLNPTNKCNFSCPICSCSEREKYKELTLEDVQTIIHTMIKYGLRAVTITGGGEPLMHPHISEIIEMFHTEKVKIGIVTNGTLLERIVEQLDVITWIRISATDYLKEQLKGINTSLGVYLHNLGNIIDENNKVDWSFSYVLGKESLLYLIEKFIRYANEHKFTHFRLVNDIFIADELKHKMTFIKGYMESNYIDDSLVNYQDRSEWTKGHNPCYLSLLKPVIGADGFVYPCCGTQYALKEPSRDYEPLMRMGSIKNLEDILKFKWYFDGSMCYKCYYGEYNRVLEILMTGLKHKEFV